MNEDIAELEQSHSPVDFNQLNGSQVVGRVKNNSNTTYADFLTPATASRPDPCMTCAAGRDTTELRDLRGPGHGQALRGRLLRRLQGLLQEECQEETRLQLQVQEVSRPLIL